MPWIDRLAILGGVVMLLESALGCWAVVMSTAFAGLEFTQLRGLAIAVAFVGSLPAYVLDARSRRRFVVFLPALCLLRLVVLRWGFDLFLIPATILLQRWKLRPALADAADPGARTVRNGTV